MPIYAYKCESCGTAKDVLQKISEPALSDCPACGQPTFRKQVTAAGFQLRGSGWYATDFRSGSPAAAGGTATAATSTASAASADAPAATAPATSHGCSSDCSCG